MSHLLTQCLGDPNVERSIGPDIGGDLIRHKRSIAEIAEIVLVDVYVDLVCASSDNQGKKLASSIQDGHNSVNMHLLTVNEAFGHSLMAELYWL
jgi:hypothetical protein